MNIQAIQQEIRSQQLDGWLFFDHHARDPLADDRVELRGGAPYCEWHQGPGGYHRSSGEGGMECVGDDGEVGQLGHGERLYPRDEGARLARPMGTDS